MKIAIILPSLKKVGPNIVASTIIKNLVKDQNIEISVYYIKPIVELSFPCKTKQLSLFNLKELYSYDIIHSHMLRPDIITSLLPFYKGRKITTIHNMVKEDLLYTHGKLISAIFSKLWMMLWKKFDYNIVLTNVAKKYYTNLGLHEDNIKVIHNGIETKDAYLDKIADINLIKEFIHNRKVIGSICLFNERKGLEQIIKALPNLENYCYIIIGDGPIKENLYLLAQRLNVQDRLLFIGFKQNPAPYFDLIDIYAMPSRSEGFGLALLEAVLKKKDIICSNINIFQELFNNDEVNFFKLDDIDDLVCKIKNIDTQKKEKAINKLLLCYTDQVMTMSYYNVYCKKK